MMRMTSFATHVPALALAAAAGALAAFTVMLSRSDALLDRSFGAALAERPTLAPTPTGAASPARENIWLSSTAAELALGLAKPVAVGDRITIAGRDGRQSVLDVTDVRELDGEVTRAQLATAPRLLLVTASIAGAVEPRLVRFIVEADEPEATPAPKPQRVL